MAGSQEEISAMETTKLKKCVGTKNKIGELVSLSRHLLLRHDSLK